jgi:hypothetical protein
MQVNPQRFQLTTSEKKGIDYFREYLWRNPEICTHCFTRIREIEEQKIKRGKNKHIEDVFEHHERTKQASNEHTQWDHNLRYGTTFCLECGSDCTPSHRDLGLNQLKPIAKRIYLYTTEETPLTLDHRRFGREIRDMKRDPSKQGKESQILAVAFSRALR